MRHSKCRYCGATIEWAITHKNRKSIPIDVGTHPDGNLAVTMSTEDGTKVLRVVPKRERLADPGLWGAEPRYMPHHATCPEVEQVRKKLARITDRQRVRRPTAS